MIRITEGLEILAPPYADSLGVFPRRFYEIDFNTEGNSKTMIQPSIHAVLIDAYHVAMIKERKLTNIKLRNAIKHLADLWWVGQRLSISHFWIMPDSEFDHAGKNVLEISDQYDTFATFEDDEQALLKFARCWKKGDTGHQVYAGYAHRGRFAWEIKHPLDILAAVDYLQQTLGVSVAWSPGYMGTALLKKLYPEGPKGERVRESTDNLQDREKYPFLRAARDVVWRGKLRDVCLGQYLHCYDKNSAFLGACTGVTVGIGDPIQFIGGEGSYASIVSKPGIYLCSFDMQDSPFNGVDLPRIIHGEGEQWVTQDVAQYALSQGYKLEISKAVIFPESAQLLRKWAERLWNARATLKEDTVTFCHEGGRMNAYNTIKQIACIGVGRFASQTATEFMRPNWWADVVGKARVGILANLLKYEKYEPVLVYCDNVYFVSPDPDIKSAVPILGRKDQLGGYKAGYTVKLTLPVYVAFETLSPAQLVGWLNKEAKHE